MKAFILLAAILASGIAMARPNNGLYCQSAASTSALTLTPTKINLTQQSGFFGSDYINISGDMMNRLPSARTMVSGQVIKSIQQVSEKNKNVFGSLSEIPDQAQFIEYSLSRSNGGLGPDVGQDDLFFVQVDLLLNQSQQGQAVFLRLHRQRNANNGLRVTSKTYVFNCILQAE